MPNDEELKEQNELENFLAELEDYVKNPIKYVRYYAMPNFEEQQFTDKEKKAFEDEYTKAVNAFNKVLPDDMKLDLDLEGFRKKMNDPKQVEMYRRISFVNKLSADKDKFQKYYKNKFAIKKTNKELPLDRVITTLMRVDDSKASDDFNKKLMNFYYKYPYEVSQAVLKGIFKADSKVYEGILKDDYERCKVYTENFERSYMAYEVKRVLDVMGNDGKIVDELKNNPMIPLLQAQSSLSTKFGSEYSFAMPKLTMEQYEKIAHKSIPDTQPYMVKITGVVLDIGFENSKNEIKLLKEKGYLNDKETALTYKAVEVKDGKEKEINLLDALKSKNPNVKIVKRSEEEKQNMLYITNGIKLRYEVVRRFKEDFVSSYNDQNPQTKIDKFDQSKILDSHKGGFFERLFNTTSNEYKEFVENFKKFTDPNNHDTSVKDKLIESAKAYIEHKNIDNVVDLAALEDGSTGKERIKLCLSVLSSLDVKLGSYKLIEDNPVVEEKKDNIVRVQVEGLEKDTNIEKTSTTKEKTIETKNKTVQVEVEKVK